MGTRRRWGASLTAVVVLAAAGGTPAAAGVRVSRAVIRPGQPLAVSAGPVADGSCRLDGPGVHESVVLTPPDEKVSFAWAVARHARSGVYRLTVTCGATTGTASVRVRGTATGPRRIGPGTAHVVEDPAVEPPDPVRAHALTWIDHLYGLYLDSRQCTGWAARRRRDIFYALNLPSVMTWARSVPGATRTTDYVGDAWTWAVFAEDDPAISVSRWPTPRALMVVARGGRIPAAGGTRTADAATGHVAYVERVRGDGSAVVSEMNGPAGPGRVDTFVLRASGLPSPDIVFLQLSAAAPHLLRRA